MYDRRVKKVEGWLDRLYIDADGASLRAEDKRKAIEVAAILDEVERAAKSLSRTRPLLLVDAAAGKSYVGLLACRIVLEELGLHGRLVLLERNTRLVALSKKAAEKLETRFPIEFREGDVADPGIWPSEPDIVVGLHACGAASDAVIDRAIASRAKILLLVPCCTTDLSPAAISASEEAVRQKIPRQAPIRRRFIQVMVDSERTRRLEAAGYRTEVVEFVGATVTPHNLLWRAHRQTRSSER